MSGGWNVRERFRSRSESLTDATDRIGRKEAERKAEEIKETGGDGFKKFLVRCSVGGVIKSGGRAREKRSEGTAGPL